jgi:hypothetical protein
MTYTIKLAATTVTDSTHVLQDNEPGYNSTTNQLKIGDGTTQFKDLTALGEAGSGDVIGPSGATNNAIVRFDSATGKLVQDSLSTVDDSGNITAPSFIGALTGNASTATAAAALATARNIILSGDISGTAAFDGSANATITTTLPTVSVTGTFKSVTVNSKGQVTAGTNPTTLAGYGISDAALASHNHTGIYQPVDADLTAIGNLTGTSGFLKKTAANTWSLDTSTYLTAVTRSMIQTPLITNTSSLALGTEALNALTSGTENTALGVYALRVNTSGSYNTAIGYQALKSHLTGGFNVSIGRNSLHTDTSGYENVAIGVNSMYNTNGGYDNTAIGQASLQGLTTGTFNTGIGCLAGVLFTTGTNNTAIGYNAVGSSATVSNTVTLGNSSISTLRCQVTSITGLSDRRDKTNIKPIVAGLDFINRLTPVSFDWNMRDGGKIGIPDTGFIAQDVQKVEEDTGITIPDLVYDDNPEKLELSPAKLIPVLVKAIQELKAEIETLKSQVRA